MKNGLSVNFCVFYIVHYLVLLAQILSYLVSYLASLFTDEARICLNFSKFLSNYCYLYQLCFCSIFLSLFFFAFLTFLYSYITIVYKNSGIIFYISPFYIVYDFLPRRYAMRKFLYFYKFPRT